MPHKFKAFVSGLGGGKTWCGCADLLKHHWEFPCINSGYFAPTYGHIRDIFYPTIQEVAADWGMTVRIHRANKEVKVFANNQYRGTIICRSMDNPQQIVGFKIGKALVDEIDIMHQEKATLAWRKIIARSRYKFDGLQNGIAVTTTPEGFKFTYKTFVTDIRNKPELANFYGLIQASTYDNELNLPSDYISSLVASYPAQLKAAYLNGQFVNLTSGSVYPDFDRKLNNSDAVINTGETLHIGMDFNVMNMSAVVFVLRDNQPIIVQEIVGVRDTPAMVALLKDRFRGHSMAIYPDASGQARKSVNASESDLSILRQAGFSVKVDSTNPAVKDRVNAVNSVILNAKGERKMLVNVNACPNVTQGLEQQSYDKNGEPNKTGGHDHLNDALGYFIAKQFPIKSRLVGVQVIKGI